MNEKPVLMTIERPQAEHEFLRFQVGTWEERPVTEPIYRGKVVVGHRVNRKETVPIFHLLGFGHSAAKAKAMAAEAVRKWKN